MTISEFRELTGFQPTLAEYEKIEEAYYNFDGDRNDFCKMFMEKNGVITICNSRAAKIEQLKGQLLETEKQLRIEIAEKERRAGWLGHDSQVEPQSMEFSIIVTRYQETPVIAMWMGEEGRWIDMSEAFLLDEDNRISDWTPGYYEPKYVLFWKPLNLPSDIDAHLKVKAGRWLGFDDEEITE